jgi:hypothetical protein
MAHRTISGKVSQPSCARRKSKDRSGMLAQTVLVAALRQVTAQL